jgi:hypothetical protein
MIPVTARFLKGLLFAVLGFVFSAWSYINWHESGYKMSERGNIGQLDDGLYGLFLLIGMGMLAYGVIEIYLNKK